MAQKTLKIPEDFWTDNAKPCIVEGDTIGEFVFDTDFDVTGADIKIQLYRSGVKVFEPTISIVNANQFKIDRVEAVDNTLPEGVSVGDLEITFSNGEKITLFKVEYKVIKEYTK